MLPGSFTFVFLPSCGASVNCMTCNVGEGYQVRFVPNVVEQMFSSNKPNYKVRNFKNTLIEWMNEWLSDLDLVLLVGLFSLFQSVLCFHSSPWRCFCQLLYFNTSNCHERCLKNKRLLRTKRPQSNPLVLFGHFRPKTYLEMLKIYDAMKLVTFMTVPMWCTPPENIAQYPRNSQHWIWL